MGSIGWGNGKIVLFLGAMYRFIVIWLLMLCISDFGDIFGTGLEKEGLEV